MTHIHADRIVDSATTTGTGNFTVAGAPPQTFRTLSAVLSTNDTFFYVIGHQSADEWEVGLGTYVGTNEFSRSAIASSNSNNAVSFSAGTKDVFIDNIAAISYPGAALNATIASASTTNIGGSHAIAVTVSGTTTITSFGSIANRFRYVIFSGALTLTHNGTSLILPGSLSIQTTAGDVAGFVSDASGNWRCLWYRRANGWIGVRNNNPQAPVHVGDLTTSPTSADSMVLIRRNIDDTTAGNAHGFADNSVVNRAGTVGVNSFDAYPVFGGTNAYDHYVSFQSRPTYGSSGAVNDVGGFYHAPILNSGTVTMHYGLWLKDPTGTSTVTNNYGIYIEPQTKGTNDWQLYSTGAAPSYFNGAIRIGRDAGNNIFSLACALDIAGTDAASSAMGFARYSANANAPNILFAKSRHATAGSHTIVANNDDLGIVYFSGSDGAQFIEAVRIMAEVDGTPGTNDMPGRIVFGTTADGASAVTDRVAIDSQGRLRPVANGGAVLGGAGLGFDSLYLSDSNDSHTVNVVYGANITANVTLDISKFRDVLTANRSYYVRTDGNDANDGLADTTGGAFLTIQKALDVVGLLDIGIYNVTINVGAGTFSRTGTNTLKPPVGYGTVTISGAGPASTTVSCTSGECFYTDYPSFRFAVTNLKLQTTTSGSGIYIFGLGLINFTNVEFGACAGVQIRAENGGVVVATGNYSVTGGAPAHWSAGLQSRISTAGRTVTFTGTFAYSNAFAVAVRAGYIQCNGMTLDVSGATVTGTRYTVQTGAIIDTNSGGANYLPGNASGSATSPGVYI